MNGPVNSAREVPGLPARAAALRLLSTILDRRRPLEEALEEPALAGALAALEARDRGFALALVRTTLRRLGQIDAALAELIDEPLPARAGPTTHILRLAAADLVFLETPAHAAVDCAVRLAGADESARHFRGLVNAVLRRISERAAAVREEDPAQTLLPDWLRQGWVRAYGESQADEIIRAHVHAPAIDLTLKPDLDPGEWAQRLGARALPTGSLRLGDHPRLTELAGYDEGAWWIQDAAAALPARLLGEVRGLKVLDLCAAPGGKTAYLAVHGAQLVAVEKSEARAVRLRENLARLRLEAEIIMADARDYIDREAFDAVLLDAPCTATGTIRRHPDIPWIKEADDVRALSLIQDELLAAAFACLRTGGRLVYSVCSLEPEEGEEVIARFLAAHPAATRARVRPEELTGAEEFVTAKGDLRTTPADWPQWGGLDGFYAARLTRL